MENVTLTIDGRQLSVPKGTSVLKAAIEAGILALKTALAGEDAEDIKEKTNTLAQASMKLGEAMYKAQQSEGAAADAAADGAGPKADDNVVDADFEEVDENNKGAA